VACSASYSAPSGLAESLRVCLSTKTVAQQQGKDCVRREVAIKTHI
jgi:hypothetical protein